MYRSPSTLKEDVRKKLSESLNARLGDGLDLHSQIKVAHWNIKGPHFAALHPLFETFAVSLANHNDAIAERAVTLGARAYGTVRHAARVSGLPEYDQETSRDLDHVRRQASSPSSRSTPGSSGPLSRVDESGERDVVCPPCRTQDGLD